MLALPLDVCRSCRWPLDSWGRCELCRAVEASLEWSGAPATVVDWAGRRTFVHPPRLGTLYRGRFAYAARRPFAGSGAL